MTPAFGRIKWPEVGRELDDGGYMAEIGSGLTLSELQEARGPLPMRVSLRILLDVMSGLSALHRARIGPKSLEFVHGEVTPDNIVIGTDYGHFDSSTEVDAITAFREAASVPEAVIEKILYDNPKALYALPV